jgi:hypothetical protein
MAGPDAPLRAEDNYHVGIVVDDPAATMKQLSSLFGYEWCDELGGAVDVTLGGRDTTVDLRAWYSKTSPRLEIVQSIPGTVWTPAQGSGIHHLGYWVDDVAAASAELERHGYQTEALGKRGVGAPYWAYLRQPTGLRVELVSRALHPTMHAYFETGTVSA